MTKRPFTDLHEIVNNEVTSHMKPFIDVTMQEHENTRKEVRDLKNLVCKVNRMNYHDVIQYAAITLIGIGTLLLLTS